MEEYGRGTLYWYELMEREIHSRKRIIADDLAIRAKLHDDRDSEAETVLRNVCLQYRQFRDMAMAATKIQWCARKWGIRRKYRRLRETRSNVRREMGVSKGIDRAYEAEAIVLFNQLHNLCYRQVQGIEDTVNLHDYHHYQRVNAMNILFDEVEEPIFTQTQNQRPCLELEAAKRKQVFGGGMGTFGAEISVGLSGALSCAAVHELFHCVVA